MALLPMTDFDPVHFKGDWTDREMKQVESAIADSEGRELPLSSDSKFALWVASRHSAGTTQMCAASRIGAPRVLSAPSTSALADKIRQFDPRTYRPLAVENPHSKTESLPSPAE